MYKSDEDILEGHGPKGSAEYERVRALLWSKPHYNNFPYPTESVFWVLGMYVVEGPQLRELIAALAGVDLDELRVGMGG